MTGQIIANGIESFTPAIDKVNTIGLEIVNYICYIGLAVFGITIAYYSVKIIIRYIKDEVLYKTRDKRRKASRNMKRRRNHKKRENENEDIF